MQYAERCDTNLNEILIHPTWCLLCPVHTDMIINSVRMYIISSQFWLDLRLSEHKELTHQEDSPHQENNLQKLICWCGDLTVLHVIDKLASWNMKCDEQIFLPKIINHYISWFFDIS